MLWKSCGRNCWGWFRKSSRSWSGFDLAGVEAEIARLEGEAAAPGYWDDPQAAQRQMQQLGRLKERAALWRGLESQAATLLELTELAIEDADAGMEEQLAAAVHQLGKDLAREEITLTLSGPYDDRPAIVSITAGDTVGRVAAGSEAQ